MNNLSFTPITIGRLCCPNRIVRSATYTYLGNKDGTVSSEQIALYERLAENGIGCIVTAHMSVIYPEGCAADDQCGLYDDRFVPGLTALATAVRRHGSRLIVQLGHAGAQNKCTIMNGKLLVAPSPVEMLTGRPARAMTAEEIRALPEAYAQAALRAKMAGADGVQLHCAHDYLLSQFLTPAWNHRTDEYGGCRENRLRLVLEIMHAIQEKVGTAYPVLIKINSVVAEGDGDYAQDLLYYIETLHAAGLTAAELSGADFAFRKSNWSAYYFDQAIALKSQTDCPLIVTGGIRTVADMERVLAEGIELVGLSRPLICEPDLVTRWQSDPAVRTQCISCSRCLKLPREGGPRCIRHLAKR